MELSTEAFHTIQVSTDGCIGEDEIPKEQTVGVPPGHGPLRRPSAAIPSLPANDPRVQR